MHPNETHRSRTTLAVMTAATVLSVGCASRAMQTESGGDMTMAGATRPAASAILAAWPIKQRETATMLIGKYGNPDVVGDRMLVWFDTGPFTKTVLMRDAAPHDFPMPHVDYLTQTVLYRVPADKADDLFEYDGSVWVHRTRGELSAQCDMEALNLLALNLAHDVASGRRSVADARAFYARTAMEFKQGNRSSPYLTGLLFQPGANAADPDKPHMM
jgi:hypothetical protein